MIYIIIYTIGPQDGERRMTQAGLRCFGSWPQFSTFTNDDCLALSSFRAKSKQLSPHKALKFYSTVKILLGCPYNLSTNRGIILLLQTQMCLIFVVINWEELMMIMGHFTLEKSLGMIASLSLLFIVHIPLLVSHSSPNFSLSLQCVVQRGKKM